MTGNELTPRISRLRHLLLTATLVTTLDKQMERLLRLAATLLLAWGQLLVTNTSFAADPTRPVPVVVIKDSQPNFYGQQFEIHIFSDHSGLFIGLRNVRKMGETSFTLSDQDYQELTSLVAAFLSAGPLVTTYEMFVTGELSFYPPGSSEVRTYISLRNSVLYLKLRDEVERRASIWSLRCPIKTPDPNLDARNCGNASSKDNKRPSN